MKAILVVDVPVLDDGRHLCNECPIWNNERMFCEYDFYMEAKGCPLKPMPEKIPEEDIDCGEDIGWNDCIEEIER